MIFLFLLSIFSSPSFAQGGGGHTGGSITTNFNKVDFFKDVKVYDLCVSLASPEKALLIKRDRDAIIPFVVEKIDNDTIITLEPRYKIEPIKPTGELFPVVKEPTVRDLFQSVGLAPAVVDRRDERQIITTYPIEQRHPVEVPNLFSSVPRCN
jgi:hypothetical protein